MASLEEIGKDRSTGTETLEVTLRHAGIEKIVLGKPDDVLRELMTYLTTVFPALPIVLKVVLTVDNKEFLESCAGNLAATPEGLVVLKETSNLKDRELLVLHLAGARLMSMLGRRESDAITLEELTRVMGRPTGTVAGRLSELWKEQLIERVGKGSYRLTTMGTRIAVRNVMPRLSGAEDK